MKIAIYIVLGVYLALATAAAGALALKLSEQHVREGTYARACVEISK